MSCKRVGNALLKIQDDFLNSPALALTLSEAERRFGLGKALCEAVMNVLTDAAVLNRGQDGRYRRHICHSAPVLRSVADARQVAPPELRKPRT
jgi:hypothetical protein